jgi:hypothetical protein
MAVNVTKTLTEFNAALALVAQAEPEVAAAAVAFRAIWGILNPTKTEQDYLNDLQTFSSQTVTDSDAVMTGLGYTFDPSTKTWSKPPVPAAPPSTPPPAPTTAG